MEAGSPLDLIQRALAPSLNKIELRDAVPGFQIENFERDMPQPLEEVFKSALGSLQASLSAMTPRDLYEIWKQSAGSGE